MGYYFKTRSRVGAVAPPTMQTFTVPSSTGGINLLDNLMEMPPTDCLYSHNLMPSELGLRLRRGYREWANIPTEKSINSIIPYEGQAQDASEDRIWAVTEDGIYDISLFGDQDPVQDVAFANQSFGAGYGVWTEFTNDATNRFLQYADGTNGIHEYSEDTGLWTVPDLTGPDEAQIAFVTTWKNRLWYIERSSGDAWYLAPDSNSGNCTKFTFGSKFKHGGELMGIFNWTVDGGNGIDDFLIAISRGGDVLVYQGTDPDTADFVLRGSYYIGETPESRKLAVGYGGELYMLSTYGLISLRDLLQGVLPSVPGATPSAKVNRGLRPQVIAGKDELTWALVSHPADGFLQIITPYAEEKDAIQWSQNLLTRAWGLWRGVPANCAETWNDRYYFGNKTGSVWVNEGVLDRTTLAGIVEFWTDVENGVEPPEWTHVGVNEFACDGTQTDETAFVVDTSAPSEDLTNYVIQYTVENYVAGSHKVRFGDAASTTQFKQNNGTFVQVIAAAGVVSVASVVGDVDFEGTIKDVSIREAGDVGEPIQFDILTSFQAPSGDHSNFKRVGFIRTIGVIAGTAAINVGAIYDYAFEATILPPVQPDIGSGNLWDNGLWDYINWDFEQSAISFPLGALDMGRTVAIAMRGSSATRLNIIGWDLTYTQGGFL